MIDHTPPNPAQPGPTEAERRTWLIGADSPGGCFSPCHGSTLGGAGRVCRGKPAPTSLEVPPHRQVGAGRRVTGGDDAA